MRNVPETRKALLIAVTMLNLIVATAASPPISISINIVCIF